jgi:hypothetical protein
MSYDDLDVIHSPMILSCDPSSGCQTPAWVINSALRGNALAWEQGFSLVLSMQNNGFQEFRASQAHKYSNI